jgi:hypothetical protein
MSYTPREKRTYEAMYVHTSHHGIRRAIKRALEKMADRDHEDARTILEALTHVSDDRIARYLARALATR